VKTERELKLKEIDPDQRVWEYDGDGTRIYKLEEGYGCKTVYTEDHYLTVHFWKRRGF
jgi:hypothetical protein